MPNNTRVSAFHWSALRSRTCNGDDHWPGVDFSGATTLFSINCCYQKHLATLRFDKVYMYARDNNCRMTSKKRRKGVYTKLRLQERQTAKAFAAHTCIEVENSLDVESSARHSAMIRHHPNPIARFHSHSDDRSINIHKNNNKGWIGCYTSL